MKLSVFFPHILDASKQTGLPLPLLLEEAKSFGIEAVELDAVHLDCPENYLDAIKAAGLDIACVNCFYALDKEFDLEIARTHIADAAKAGTDKLLIVPGFLTEDDGYKLKEVIHDREKTFQFLDNNPTALQIIRNMIAIVQMASEKNLKVVVEDFDNLTSPISGLNGVLWFLDRVPELYCAFDTGNFITHSEDVLEAWEQLKTKTIHIHCKDRSDTAIALGKGWIPMDALITRFKAAGYNDTLAIEHYGAEDQRSCIRDSAAFMVPRIN